MDKKVKEFIVQNALDVDEQRLTEIKENTFKHIDSLLATKGEEYSQKVNRLENFIDGAHMNQETPEEALWGMLTKHILSINKFIREVPLGIRRGPIRWAEKTDDIITYMILLKAITFKRYEVERAIDKGTNDAVLKEEELQYKANLWDGKDGPEEVDDEPVTKEGKALSFIMNQDKEKDERESKDSN